MYLDLRMLYYSMHDEMALEFKGNAMVHLIPNTRWNSPYLMHLIFLLFHPMSTNKSFTSLVNAIR